MNNRHKQQFSLPATSREQLSAAIDFATETREIAPTLCDWLRDRLVDELADRLEYRESEQHELHEPRGLLELPFNWTESNLAAALVWCHSAIYALKDYHLGQLADTLHGAVIAAAAARLRRLEYNAYVRSA
jgi:hypothetical protein